ncbi:TonB-dependent receptor [Rufibacter sediminis]|uniref:TonB-dependent receptor plug domain-containing protein n=1 Tax=Rufibacter sediminis TaxID=2762756 RepID=A0ABR6VSJ0_9BACT|nr:TonB-dependent receptor [Rufibacter sediminis]MBC3540167.1 TonB-dependent receptor plug domain-containing protein [Rufibacter sediminis]
MKYLFAFFFLLSFLPARAQVTIEGRVLDARSQQPLEGAMVSETVTGNQVLTGAAGQFRIVLASRFDTLVVQRLTSHRVQKLVVPPTGKQLVVLLEPLAVNLQEVMVRGYETRQPLQRTAGAIGLLSTRDLERFSQATLVPALNTLPGVRMEERATASYRISIRGSSLRAPYGVRNVKVYLNEVPLVEANGTIPLNMLDAGTIGNIEVLKGPAGSVYGAGTGGTILLETVKPLESSVAVGGLVGSYGLRRGFAAASVASEKSNLLLRYDRQTLDGYREQSAMDRKNVLLSGQFFPNQKQTFSFHALYSDLFYELPGALTREQFEANPRAARQDNVNQKAALNLEGLNLGFVHNYQFNERWSNTTSLFGVFSFLNHPFVTDYERNVNQSFGARTRTTYRTTVAGLPSRFTLGAEGQRRFVNARQYVNNAGTPGALNYDDEVTVKEGFVFGQAEVDLPANFLFTLGASLNALRYDLARVSEAATNPEGYQQSRSIDAQFSPRVGLVKVITPSLSAHASVSAGFSPPTEGEIRPSDASINLSLQPERGVNYEAGIRGSLFHQRFTFDVVAFQFRLKETIVSRTVASSVAVFANAGSTRQQGVEVAAGYAFVQAPDESLRLLRLWGTYTYNRFRFLRYQQNENDFSGNRLTGTAPHVAVAGLDVESRLGLYLNATANYSDQIPLNDANTVYAPDYLVLGAQAGFRRTLAQTWHLDLYGGIDNATDRDYSLGNDLNAFRNRYFQAAPGRNFYSGVQLRKSF